MKVIKILGSPYTVVIAFLMIIISGQHVGGFYVVYLLLAMPHGGVHSVLAFFGIVLLLLSYHKYKRKHLYKVESVMNILGTLLLLLSLFFFFFNDKEHYNYGTFTQLVPQISLFTFFIVAAFFIANNLSGRRKDHSLT